MFGEMKGFLQGFNKKENKVEEKFSEELTHLKAIYERAIVQNRDNMQSAIRPVVHYMKTFIAEYEKNEEIQEKLDSLKHKMGCEECSDE